MLSVQERVHSILHGFNGVHHSVVVFHIVGIQMVNSYSRVIRNKSTLIRFTFFAAWHLWTFISHKSDLAFLLQPHRRKLLNGQCIALVEKKKALTYLRRSLSFKLTLHTVQWAATEPKPSSNLDAEKGRS